MERFNSATRREKAQLVFYVLLHYFVIVLTFSYVFLAFREDKPNSERKRTLDNEIIRNSTEEISSGRTYADEELDWKKTWKFAVIVYLGFALGPLLSGAASYFAGVRRVKGVMLNLCVLSSLFGSYFMDDATITCHHLSWFLLGFTSFGWYMCCYIFILERIPASWVLFTGLAIFPVGLTTSRLYGILLVACLDSWRKVLLWNALFIVLTKTLVEMAEPRTNSHKSSQETLWQLLVNPIGKRYLLSFALLWAVHGYICFGISHQIQGDTVLAQMYVCVTDFMANLLGFFLCQWTRQKRIVMSAVFMLCGVCSFALAVSRAIPTLHSFTSTLAQICSFLITSSGNILWLLSIQTIGSGTRCLTQGLFYFLARAGSLLGALAVRNEAFLLYPSAVIGILCFIGSATAVFLLHGPPINDALPAKTRAPKKRTVTPLPPSLEEIEM